MSLQPRDDAHESRIKALALIAARKDGQPVALKTDVAVALLGSVRTFGQSIDNPDYLFPKKALEAAGCDLKAWERSQFPIRTIGNEAHYQVPHLYGSYIIPSLEAWADKTLGAAKILAGRPDSSLAR